MIFSKSDVAGIEDSGSCEQGSRAIRRMSVPLLITGASSVRDRNVTMLNRQFSKPGHPASASASIVADSKHGASLPQKCLSKRSRLSNRTDIDFATVFLLLLVLLSSTHILPYDSLSFTLILTVFEF